MIGIERLVRSLPRQPLSLKDQTVLACGCVLAAALAREALDPALSDGPFITFYPAVLVASVWGGVRSGAVTLGLGAMMAAYFWLPPVQTLHLTKLSATTLAVFLLAGCIILFCAHLLHAAAAMAREAEERARLIAGEMRHRIGNSLALVQSIARLSARHATTPADFERQLSARIDALAAAQALTAPAQDLPPDLETLLRAVIRPFDVERIALAGPPAAVADRDRPMLALLVHELCTNAVKYGALSVPEGKVMMAWSHSVSGVRLEWRECGGPAVSPPVRSGFGTQLANSAFPRSRGAVSLVHDAAGLRCNVTLLATERPPGDGAAEATPLPGSRAAPLGG